MLVGADGGADYARRVPRLAPGCDPATLDLTPAEGFLLSRIDDVTPWKLLRELGGLSPEEVDLCLEGWLARGLIECREIAPPRPPKAAPTPRKPATYVPREIDTASLDESLDIDVETQRRILELETKLDAPYHEILGVSLEADAKAVKRAYFDLSKEFHPDRYFRKEIGAYEKRLHAIFKRILEAYELLSDPAVRAEVQRSMSAAARTQPTAPAPTSPGQPPRELTRLERLRARMPYKLPPSVLVDRQARAREFWEAARRSVSQSKFIEAASAVRLAIAFDPFNDVYRAGFGEVQVRAVEMKAEALVAEAEEARAGGLVDAKHAKELLRLYEEALLYRPHEPELNTRAARAAVDCQELGKAREYAERALEHSPDVAEHHVTAALIHREQGNRGHAVKALEKALELQPGHLEASRMLATLKRA